jgi:hypothetical protein
MCKTKSTFVADKIKFMGHVVNFEGIRPDPKLVEVVQNWHVAKNVQRFVHFLGWLVILKSLFVVIWKLLLL